MGRPLEIGQRRFRGRYMYVSRGSLLSEAMNISTFNKDSTMYTFISLPIFFVTISKRCSFLVY